MRLLPYSFFASAVIVMVYGVTALIVQNNPGQCVFGAILVALGFVLAFISGAMVNE